MSKFGERTLVAYWAKKKSYFPHYNWIFFFENMSKFRIMRAEWLDPIKNIFFPCLELPQATLTKLVISSFPPKWLIVMGVGILNKWSGWPVELFLSWEVTVTSWFPGEQWESDSSRVMSGASIFFAIVASRLFSILGVWAVDSELISAPKWRRSAL